MAKSISSQGSRCQSSERERKTKENNKAHESSQISFIDAIHEIAIHNANAEIEDEKHLMLFLQSWWSNEYKRPLKDPLLQQYTLAELLYEFYNKIEREKAQDDTTEENSDKIEDERRQANLAWAEEEEKKELEQLQKEQEIKSVDDIDEKTAQKIVNDPDNQKWMKEQLNKELEEGKKVYGDDFGEDLDAEFDADIQNDNIEEDNNG